MTRQTAASTRQQAAQNLAYLITAFRSRERRHTGPITDEDTEASRPMTEFLAREGFHRPDPEHLELDELRSRLASALADQIHQHRRAGWGPGRSVRPVTIGENELEGIQKILDGASRELALPPQVIAGIGHLTQSLPARLREEAREDQLRTDVESLLSDLERSFPDPAPFTTEHTVIDRLRTALEHPRSDSR